MDRFKEFFERQDLDFSDIDVIVDNSEKIVETALAMSQDDARAVVILCLALAKTCVNAKIPVTSMVESILEIEETYLTSDAVGDVPGTLDN